MDPDPNEVLVLDPRSQPSRYYLTGMLMPSIREEIEGANAAEASTPPIHSEKMNCHRNLNKWEQVAQRKC